ncbi:MAG: GNAT family N-acetyltransferase [Azospirillaceae bacterium]|nr:GNAT family N-acetyltransferase [Azospirillaceae bacterium]
MRSEVDARKAQEEDRWAIWKWFQDCAARRAWHRDAVLDREAYKTWFNQIMTAPDHLLLIGVVGTIRIGIVRFDRQSPDVWRASLMLRLAFWGQNYGTRLLSVAIDRLQEYEPVGTVVMAPSLITEPVRRMVTACGITLEAR